MGQDATATLSEIEAARQRLEKDIDELDRRARPEHDLPEQAQRLAVAGAAGVAGAVVLVGLARRRIRRAHEHHRARLQAEMIADVLEHRRRSLGVGLDLVDEGLQRDAAIGGAALAGVGLLGTLLGRALSRR